MISPEKMEFMFYSMLNGVIYKVALKNACTGKPRVDSCICLLSVLSPFFLRIAPHLPFGKLASR